MPWVCKCSMMAPEDLKSPAKQPAASLEDILWIDETACGRRLIVRSERRVQIKIKVARSCAADRPNRSDRLRHWEPTGRANARPMTGSASSHDVQLHSGESQDSGYVLRDHSGMTESRFIALSPVADAAGPARPDLNPCNEGLGIERIAMSCQLRSRRTSRFLRTHDPGLFRRDGGFGLGFRAYLRFNAYLGFSACLWFHACLRIRAAVIDVHVKRTRCKPRGRPKRLRRKHRL